MKGRRESNVAIYASIAANVAIAAVKLVVAGLTGSSAMVGEGVHSLVDCADGALLLLGRRRSRKPPDDAHPFGYGRELYFWTLIVAILFFALGGGVSVLEGVARLRSPEPLRDPKWSYVVLAASLLFDGSSFVVGYRQFRAQAGDRGFWEAVRDGKDPSVFSVVLEDIGDMAGLVIAFLGVFLSHHFRQPMFDGLASIGVGLVLAAVAVVLIVQCRELLLGEAADPATVRGIERAAVEDPAVRRVRRVRTSHLGPHEVVAVLEVELDHSVSVDTRAVVAHHLDARVRAVSEDIRYVFLEVGGTEMGSGSAGSGADASAREGSGA